MKKPSSFVIMPYDDDHEKIYNQVIIPTLSKYRFSVILAKDIKNSKAMINNIHNGIQQSDLIIAICDNMNINVYYELGVATSIGKEIILITNDRSALPLDVRHKNFLKYSMSKLNEFKEEFENYVLNTRTYTSFKKREPVKVLNRGDLFPSFIDAAFILDEEHISIKQKIQNYLDRNMLFPNKYVYQTDLGVARWLTLCNDPEYTFYQKSISFFSRKGIKIIQTIYDSSRSGAYDFVSLGPGDGKKDYFLLRDLNKLNDKKDYIYYYPFDISHKLLSVSINNILNRKEFNQDIKIKCIVSDFNNIPRFIPVFQYRMYPKIYSLLGNTLGNIEKEVELLKQVGSIMNPEDFLIVEVKSCTDEDTKGKIALNRLYDFSLLEFLDIDYDPKKLSYTEDIMLTQIEGTRTITAVYSDFTYKGVYHETQHLSIIKEYNASSLKETLNNIGFVIIDDFSFNYSICLLLRKKY